MISMEWWNNPTSKHAFILAWISVILEFFASFGGVALYMVRRCLFSTLSCCVLGLYLLVSFVPRRCASCVLFSSSGSHALFLSLSLSFSFVSFQKYTRHIIYPKMKSSRTKSQSYIIYYIMFDSIRQLVR